MTLDEEIVADLPPATDPYLGLEFGGRYRVDELIAAGGMGTVYRGTHIELGTTVAIKFLHRHLASAKGSILYQRFRNEARIAAQLKHPNIARATDFGRTKDNVPYLVMEYLEGEPLSSYLEKKGKLEPRLAVDLARGVLAALHAAHSVDIVHRDIKPDNIFIVGWKDNVPHVKVLDFGIAKLGDATVQTQAGHVLGTMAYMSPEQLQDTSRVDVRTDVYAVAVTLYQMLCGGLPYQSASLADLALRIMKGNPERLESLRPELPDGLASLVHTAMSSEPSERPPSALAFFDALDPYGSKQSDSAPQGMHVAPALGTAASAASMLGEERTKKARVSMRVRPGRQRLKRVGLLGLLVGSLGLAGFLLAPRNADNVRDIEQSRAATDGVPARELGSQRGRLSSTSNLDEVAAAKGDELSKESARDEYRGPKSAAKDEKQGEGEPDDEAELGDDTALDDEAELDDDTELDDEAELGDEAALNDEAELGDEAELDDEAELGDDDELGDDSEDPRSADNNATKAARTKPSASARKGKKRRARSARKRAARKRAIRRKRKLARSKRRSRKRRRR